MEKLINQIYNQFEKRLITAIVKAIQEKIQIPQNEPDHTQDEWMKLKDAAKYLGVSEGTFSRLRIHGLKVFEDKGTKRVNKKDLERYMKKNSN